MYMYMDIHFAWFETQSSFYPNDLFDCGLVYFVVNEKPRTFYAKSYCYPVTVISILIPHSQSVAAGSWQWPTMKRLQTKCIYYILNIRNERFLSVQQIPRWHILLKIRNEIFFMEVIEQTHCWICNYYCLKEKSKHGTKFLHTQ